MKTSRVFVVALAGTVLTGLVSASALGQNPPFSGSIPITFTTSTSTPQPGTTFTVSMFMDLRGATATCATGGGETPFTLGGSNIGILFDTAAMEYVSTAACPRSPVEISRTCRGLSIGANCVVWNLGNTDQPSNAKVCVARLTLRSITATSVGPGSFSPTITPKPRGIASNYVLSPVNCGGPALFTGPIQ